MEGYYQLMQEVAGDRTFPQWSYQETKELLAIRAELDRSFMETKRNKVLWELVSSRMLDKGFPRTPDQCKSKWKNLVTRYKGCETMEPEAMRQQFPFYNDLHAIFSARMQSMLWAEKRAAPSEHLHLSDDEEEGEEGEEEYDWEKGTTTTAATTTTTVSPKAGPSSSGGGGGIGSRKRKKTEKASDFEGHGLKEVLEEFMRQQEASEAKWREAWEAREEERLRREDEWRRKMAALQEERALAEMRWREREDQRRSRQEARALKRDALVDALLNKLARGDI